MFLRETSLAIVLEILGQPFTESECDAFALTSGEKFEIRIERMFLQERWDRFCTLILVVHSSS